MDCALHVIEYFATGSDMIAVAPRALDMLAVEVLKILPDEVSLQTAYTSWWDHEKDGLELIYNMATDPEFW